ncbi:MAG TPA: cupin-like domain-containing protein [Saprospiraceae bacterium]|nr:cupin-like domain-containing protein [Saprospiraceae bacterium]
MQISKLDKVAGLDRASFIEHFLKPMKPVVFTDLIKDWSALQNWTVENFKSKYGNLKVSVYTNKFEGTDKGFREPDKHMLFGDFLDLLVSSEPCDLRLFLFNIFKYAPELRGDFDLPDITDGFYNDLPSMFFGGKGSKVAMHYGLDLSHVFLNQIYGKERVVLFSPDQSRFIYQLPYSVAGNIDINNPDYDRYPALRNAKGEEVVLNPGESLFIPSGYWHYIEYVEGGYSVSLRANESIRRRMKGAANIATHFIVDKGMNRLLGSKWREIKDRMVIWRAQAMID